MIKKTYIVIVIASNQLTQQQTTQVAEDVLIQIENIWLRRAQSQGRVGINYHLQHWQYVEIYLRLP